MNELLEFQSQALLTRLTDELSWGLPDIDPENSDNEHFIDDYYEEHVA